MTPLAAELLEDLYSYFWLRPAYPIDGSTNEKHLRNVFWTCVHSCKFFDCAEVANLANHLAFDLTAAFEKYDRVDQRHAFLPAEWTWIEIESPGFNDDIDDKHDNIKINDLQHPHRMWNYTYRTAFVFFAPHGVTHTAKRYQISYETPRPPDKPRYWRIKDLGTLPLVHSGMKPQRYLDIENSSGQVRHFEKPTANTMDFVHYALLALINTPRVIGQRIHMPHERIERDRLKQMKLVGKFPLRAWTEIVLKVALPEHREGEEPRESHLTGEKCLHYCRTYLRVRNGLIEYVEGHWRGDPALGMKRSRYRLQRDSTK